MDKSIEFRNQHVRLHSYKASGSGFNFVIEVRPEVGRPTPIHWNKFNCGFKSLREATNSMRHEWSKIKKQYRKVNTCNCKAYSFPHRLGSGKCNNTSLSGPLCGSCGCSCTPRVVDNGIGSYEYWGATGVYHDYCVESDCCCGTVYKNQSLTEQMTTSDVEEYYSEF